MFLLSAEFPFFPQRYPLPKIFPGFFCPWKTGSPSSAWKPFHWLRGPEGPFSTPCPESPPLTFFILLIGPGRFSPTCSGRLTTEPPAGRTTIVSPGVRRSTFFPNFSPRPFYGESPEEPLEASARTRSAVPPLLRQSSPFIPLRVVLGSLLFALELHLSLSGHPGRYFLSLQQKDFSPLVHFLSRKLPPAACREGEVFPFPVVGYGLVVLERLFLTSHPPSSDESSFFSCPFPPFSPDIWISAESGVPFKSLSSPLKPAPLIFFDFAPLDP